MTTFPVNLNDAGMAHVVSELKRLGLDWDASATASEIEDRAGFMDMEPDGRYEYEVSNTMAGKKGYGVFGWIEILPEHVDWEEVED